MSITTKTGDDGTTELLGGRRVPKDHPVIECLGTIDELNAFLGDAKVSLGGAADPAGTVAVITGIQKELFALSGVLAGGMGPVPGDGRLCALINELEAKQPPLMSFVVPGADAASAKLHIARTVCRRVERRIVSLGRDRELPDGILPYFNRLSDLLFLLGTCRI
jgi:cob(I)alamin adenosyltransferase